MTRVGASALPMRTWQRHRWICVALLLWSGVLLASASWNFRQAREALLATAHGEADHYYRKLYDYRHWNARQGGIYVPVSATITPNPYLAGIPERDVRTPSGRLLTLVNPAYMLRKILEVNGPHFGPRGHLTSLRPINPENRPDPWERRALLAFEGGTAEVSGVERLGDGDYYRLMRPLPVETECLKCHAVQGYRLGDIRGGLSASVPLAPLRQRAQGELLTILFAHLPLWGVGAGGIALVGRRFQRQNSRHEKLEETVRRLSQFDKLTGLPNLVLFNDRLRIALAQAHRRQEALAVLCLDLDRFKRINNTLGHAAGDRLLQLVAERLHLALREGDSAARLGGDSFTVLLPGLSGSDEAVRFIDRLQQSLAQPYLVGGEPIYLTTSFGVAVYPADGDDAGVLLKHADNALHRAKEQRRGSWQFYTPEMKGLAMERMALESSLRRALEQEEFVLHYQPQIDAASGRLIGAEALLRWAPPGGGLLAPGAFLAVAEESGLIVPIDLWVLRNVCRQLAAWRAAGLQPPRVSVNLSARQFREPDLVATVAAILSENRVPAELLGLEITESAVMDDVARAATALAELKALGVHLSIDDFGTGYSSLNYLRLFPLDTLKIDRSFVVDLPHDPNSAGIVGAIIALARSLNLAVLAEGAENHAQLAFLRSHDCHDIQGYLFSAPLPAATLAENYLATAGVGRRGDGKP